MDATVKQNMINAGYDVDGALARFVNNETLYLMFMKKFPNDENYAKIEGELQAEDFDSAYASVHAFKGVAGNLGITDVFENSVRLLDLLKKRDTEVDVKAKALEIYADMKITYEKACGLIGEL